MKASIEQALKDFKQGKMLIVVDDEDRENEGDLVMAAQWITPEAINFMASHGKGMICAPLTSDKAKELDLPQMIQQNTSAHYTAFTVTVDAAKGTSTGISAADRALTLRELASSQDANDFVRPGHIFPLIAKDGGVLVRPGHTEAAVDLCRLSELNPVGVICEIMNSDGTMARMNDLEKFAIEHQLKIITIKDLIKYRVRTERLIQADVSVPLPTEFGQFQMTHFSFTEGEEEHIALTMGLNEVGQKSKKTEDDSILTRVHSACFTGDIFSSKRCDCGEQLKESLRMIAQRKKGILIYLNQEGRGIGLLNKLKSYQLQDQGMDTVSANLSLGLPVDNRNYHFAYQVLKYFNIQQVELITNNPEKIKGLEEMGLKVRRVASQTHIHSENSFYLKTKKQKLNHLLDLQPEIKMAEEDNGLNKSRH